MNLAFNLAWQLNDTITYSVTASQTWQDLFICISLSCFPFDWREMLSLKTTLCNVHHVIHQFHHTLLNLKCTCTCALQYRSTLGTATRLSYLVHFFIIFSLIVWCYLGKPHPVQNGHVTTIYIKPFVLNFLVLLVLNFLVLHMWFS